MCERAGSVESTHFPIAVQVFLNFTVVKADFLGHICLSVVRRRIKLFRYNDAMLRVIIFHSSFNTAGADTFPEVFVMSTPKKMWFIHLNRAL